LNCPYCDKEILDEDATFCPKCGKSLTPECELEQNSVDMPQKRSDLVLAAAILSIVAAAFSAGLGYTAIYQYMSLISYYGHDVLHGFLILGAQGIVVSAFAIVGGMFMLKRKYLIISMLGVVLLVVSVFGTYITIQHYQYGFTEIVLFSEISILIFSILSGILLLTSKAEFT
jgi:hypothetical protein